MTSKALVAHRLTRLVLALCLYALILPALPSTLVRAAGTTYYVGTLTDDAGTTITNCAVATNSDCTLRDAIAVATSGQDTIQFDANANSGVYTLDTGAGQGTLVLAHNVTITGPGSARVAIDGGLNVSTGSGGTIVFIVTDFTTATISGLEITHGNNQGTGGGGIYSSGSLTLVNDLIDHNNTDDIGGGVDSPGGFAATTFLTVMGCTITNNTASNGSGGGIYAGGDTVSITNSTISNNRGGTGGGAGGIFLAVTTGTITNSTIAGNSVTNNVGGGIYLFSGTLTITGSTISGNTAASPGGGGIRDAGTGPLIITDSTISGNTATGTGSGGGILESGTSLALTRVSITNNTAGGSGGGISATVPITITGSSISGNTATDPASSGGGLNLLGANAMLVNDTVAGNTAGNSGSGIYNQGGHVALTAVTVSGNRAGFSQFYTSSGPVTLMDTLIVNSLSPVNCDSVTFPSPFMNGGNNLQFPGSSCGNTIPSADPKLDPAGLKDNGGPTRTIALLPSSPAIDAAPAAGGQCPATDQRGIARPQGNGCDIGAYEYVPVRPTVTGTYTTSTGGGLTLTLTGTGFQRGSVVSVGGAALPGSVVTSIADDGTTLRATLPPHAAGVVTLSVVNPGNLTSAATGNLTYIAPNAQPMAHTTAATATTKPKPLEPTHTPVLPVGMGAPTPLPQPTRH